MSITKLLLGTALAALCAPQLSRAAELEAQTLKAWDDYIRDADLHLRHRLDSHQPFLWIDESPDRALAVRQGKVVVAPREGRGTRGVPDGLIHDWIGAIFIPHATLENLWAVVHDYNNYKRFYQPVVVQSRVLSCTEEDQEFSMVWQRHILFVNAAMQSRYQARDVAVDAHRGYNIADSTEVREIENFGHAGEHLLPPDTGNGFIWRLHSIARYEQRDGGVYLELEAIALTRDIPASLRWLVNPVVNHLSINSLTTTLRQTRSAVNSAPVDTGAVCPNVTRTWAKAESKGDN